MKYANVAQSVEHSHGKGKVRSSILRVGSIIRQVFIENTTIALLCIGHTFCYNVCVLINKKIKNNCLVCKKETARARYKYCSNACQQEYQYRQYIKKWKIGEEIGLQSIGVVSRHIKRYLRDKFGNKCCLCGWSQVNQKSYIVPLVADHVDGNWRNNTEKNLRLVCPNCDALSPTYAALNKGRGRKNRTVSNRAKEAHRIVNR